MSSEQTVWIIFEDSFGLNVFHKKVGRDATLCYTKHMVRIHKLLNVQYSVYSDV